MAARRRVKGVDGSVRWWALRRAQSRKPATYRCPFCGGYLLPRTMASMAVDVRLTEYEGLPGADLVAEGVRDLSDTDT